MQSKFNKGDLCSLWTKGTGSVLAIEEYIRRAVKINKERAYCNKFLQSAYYFQKIDGVRVEIDILDDIGGNDGKITHYFSDNDSESNFFEDPVIQETLKKHGWSRS